MSINETLRSWLLGLVCRAMQLDHFSSAVKSVTSQPLQEQITYRCYNSLVFLNFGRGMTCRIFFQLDKSPSYFDRCVRDFLNTNFPNRWTGRRGLLEWSLRSLDFTPCDFFLWSNIKSKVYITKPLDLSELKERIHTACSAVGEEMLRSVGEAALKGG